jgi:thiamine pyrophosphate-dependent acetolactate synthase large subunit-like protein
MDYQALPPADLSMLASPDRLVDRLLDALPARAKPASEPTRRPVPESAVDMIDGRLSVQAMARTTTDMLARHNPAYIRLPLGWPGDCCRFADPLDYIGFDGGGGVGAGPGITVGAALALKGSGRIAIGLCGDGDFLMGNTAVWTAAHYGIPCLMIVCNNRSYYNDELHQERVAVARARPAQNRWIGQRISEPDIDIAAMAGAQGAVAVGPVTTLEDMHRAMQTAMQAVREGKVCVIDARVLPGYDAD